MPDFLVLVVKYYTYVCVQLVFAGAVYVTYKLVLLAPV